MGHQRLADFSHSCKSPKDRIRGVQKFGANLPYVPNTNAVGVVRCPYCVSDYEFRPMTASFGRAILPALNVDTWRSPATRLSDASVRNASS
jgi:hypothetical protein